MTFFKESRQRIASFSLKKSLTKRRLCEAYEKPQWKDFSQNSAPSNGRTKPYCSLRSHSSPPTHPLLVARPSAFASVFEAQWKDFSQNSAPSNGRTKPYCSLRSHSSPSTHPLLVARPSAFASVFEAPMEGLLKKRTDSSNGRTSPCLHTYINISMWCAYII